MNTPCSLLPSEVWLHALRFLTPSDWLKVRCVCKDFRDLVDSSSLLRNWTVRLKRRNRLYNEGFWETLRRWRVTSVVLFSLKHCTTISKNLPGLSTLIVDDDCDGSWKHLQSFKNLKRVFLKHHRNPPSEPLDRLFSLVPKTLTHLSVCEYNDLEPENFVINYDLTFLSQMINLRFLVCHAPFEIPPAVVVNSILTELPHLTHLSVRLDSYFNDFRHFYDDPLLTHRSLCSLEVLGSVFTLPKNTMKMLPSLCSLALFIEDEDVSTHSKLSLWLKDLPALTSLLVCGGPPLRDFVKSIPSSVTDIDLCLTDMTVADLKALSEQLQLLLKLRLKYPAGTAFIPKLFPKLQSLGVQHRHISEEMFLSLAELKELQLLETLDPIAPPHKLVSKLRDLTKNRLEILQRPQPDREACWCLSDLPSKNWIKLRQ